MSSPRRPGNFHLIKLGKGSRRPLCWSSLASVVVVFSGSRASVRSRGILLHVRANDELCFTADHLRPLGDGLCQPVVRLPSRAWPGADALEPWSWASWQCCTAVQWSVRCLGSCRPHVHRQLGRWVPGNFRSRNCYTILRLREAPTSSARCAII